MTDRTRQKQRHIDALDIAHLHLLRAVENGLIAAMARGRGYSEQEAQKIARQVEKIARRLFKQALSINTKLQAQEEATIIAELGEKEEL